jgi:hypothetical protein
MARYRIVRHCLKIPPKPTQYFEDPVRRRYRRNAIMRGDSDNVKRVPPAQRSVFEGLQDKLKVLQQTVSTARAQETATIRQSQKLDRGQDFRH